MEGTGLRQEGTGAGRGAGQRGGGAMLPACPQHERADKAEWGDE